MKSRSLDMGGVLWAAASAQNSAKDSKDDETLYHANA